MRLQSSFLSFLFLFCLLPPSFCKGLELLGGVTLISIGALSGQISSAEGSGSFFHSENSTFLNILERLAPAPSGGYQGGGHSNSNALCAKYFDNGTLDFNTFTYSTPSRIIDSAITPNGNMWAAGEIDYQRGYIALINQECKPVWDFELLGGTSFFSSIVPSSNSSALFLGWHDDGAQVKIILLKMSSSGTKVWDREVVFSSSVYGDMYGVAHNHSLYVAGVQNASGSLPEHIFLLKMTESGELQYSRGYDLSSQHSLLPRSLEVTPSGDLLLTGQAQQTSGADAKIFYAKIEAASGQVIYFYRVGSGVKSGGTAIIATQAGGVVLGGHYEPDRGGRSAIILEADLNGVLTSTYFFPTLRPSSNGQVDAILQEQDGSFTVVGHSDGFLSFSSFTNLFIARVGGPYGLGCSLNMSVHTVDETSKVAIYTPNATVNPLSASLGNISHTLGQSLSNIVEGCVITEAPTSSPSLQPTRRARLDPSFSPSLESSVNSRPVVVGYISNQEVLVGDFYLRRIGVTAVFYDEEGDLLTLSISASSLQGHSVDWLQIYSHNHTLSGTPELEDQILILVNATDPKGASAGTSFELRTKKAPSSSPDFLRSFVEVVIVLAAAIGGFALMGCVYCLLPMCVEYLGTSWYSPQESNAEGFDIDIGSSDMEEGRGPTEMNQLSKNKDINSMEETDLLVQGRGDTIIV